MELTKEIAQMICDLEYRIGACCYNPHSTNGYTGEIGRTLRFPVTVYDEEKEHVEHKTRNNYRYYISNPEDVKKLTYLVGANHFHIGVGLIRVLRYLESEYKINFNELEEERQKRIQKEEAQREKLEKVLPRDAVWEAISEYGEEHYEAFSISGWQVATRRYEQKMMILGMQKCIVEWKGTSASCALRLRVRKNIQKYFPITCMRRD